MSQKICVARIGAPHGVRGEVRLWTFTEDPLAVLHYGPLTTRDGSRAFEVTKAFGNANCASVTELACRA